MTTAVVVLSGGMDSTATLAKALDDGHDVKAVSFNYGQRHVIELNQAMSVARHYNIEHRIVDIRTINDLIHKSVLTDHDRDVPEGYYTDENMKQTVVPNRNMIMASIAVGWCVDIEADCMYMGQHAGDHAVYPDCRPQFISALDICAKVANEGFLPKHWTIVTPWIHSMKWDIAEWSVKHEVPLGLTHTCYNGLRPACGRCATCVERLEAFWVAEARDPLEYEDRQYWKEVSDEYAART